MPKPLQERARLLEAANAAATTTGRRLMQIISPGWGSSGYYGPAVLEQAAADNVIPAGTHMYADHPTEEEATARPGRSIKDLISVTTTDARLATAEDVAGGADPGALVAEIRVASPYRELIDDLGSDIGVSIRGDATDISIGEAEGRNGRIIEGLAHVSSVDWVTRAGRGGRVLQVLESARLLAEAKVSDAAWSGFSQADYTDAQWQRACLIHGDGDGKAAHKLPVREPDGTLNRNGCHAAASVLGGGRGGVSASADATKAAAKKLVGLYRNQLKEDPPDSLLTAAGMKAKESLAEATVNDTREALTSELGDAYASDNTWVWVRDFDDTTVWFELDGPNGGDLYAQAYTQSADGSVALTGDRTEVRVVTTYVPATRPDGTTTTESREDTMPQIQIEESEHTRLVEAAGRVTTLENERATAVQRAEAAERRATVAEAALAERDRRDRATALISERATEGGIAFTALEARGLLAELPLTESGELDEAAFTTTVDTNVAEKKRTAGAGTPRGFGAFQTGGGVAEGAEDKLAAIDTALGIKKGA
jgi:hypothetical protein